MSIEDDTLLENTNRLLAHVGMKAKKIETINELVRVASSMFVAVFEEFLHTRLDGIIRNPKCAEDYINNCQTIIDGLSHQLQTNLRHITGELIFRGDRRALNDLVRLFMRITNMTGDVKHDDDHDSGSISSHESAFPQERELIISNNKPNFSSKNQSDLKKSLHLPIQSAIISQRQNQNDLNESMINLHDINSEIRMSPPWSPVSTGFHASHSHSHSTLDNRNDEINEYNIINTLRHSLSEYEQYRKVETARRRREIQLRKKSLYSQQKNQYNLELSCTTLQNQWNEDVNREMESAMLKLRDADSVFLRKLHKGMIKELYTSKESSNQEIKAKIQEIRRDTKLHFESLQNLFNDRVQIIRELEKTEQSKAKETLHEYKIWTDNLKKAQKTHQKQITFAQKQLLEQKRDYSAKMRKDAHKQLLSFVSMNDSWEDSLRSDPINHHFIHLTTNSTTKNKIDKNSFKNNNQNIIKSSSLSKTTTITRKSPYATAIAPPPSLSSRKPRSSTPSKKVRRSRSVS